MCYGWMCEDIPEDVTHVRIYLYVRANSDHAFNDQRRTLNRRSRLRIVMLNDVLEVIGACAFEDCISLEQIVIPKAVRRIEMGDSVIARLTAVTLGEGLKTIGAKAFLDCKSLEHICSNLSNMEFCPQIEEYVSCEAMRDWWNHGVNERCLRTYCFLVRCSIPERLSLVRVQCWRADIYDMLGRIPTVSKEGMESFFVSIDSRLSLYENLKE